MKDFGFYHFNMATKTIFSKELKTSEEYIKEFEKLKKQKFLEKGYDPKVHYTFNNKVRGDICFSSIYNRKKLKPESNFSINLLFNKRNKLLTSYTNINKYFKHLSSLYSGITVKLRKEVKNNELWADIICTKKYKNVVIRDLSSRIRYLFEGGICGYMEQILNKKDFNLEYLDATLLKTTMSSYEGCYINTGHFFYSKSKDIIPIKYSNYENYYKDFIKEVKGNNSLHKFSQFIMDKQQNND